MISASAVGYYPEKGTFDEYTNTRGSGFLAELCYAWEKEARRCPSQTRLVITRFGIVLSPDGGAMEQMLRPLRITRVAGVIGPGTQPFPWIAIQDLCRAMEFIIRHEEASGVFNLVAPQQVSQYAFTQAMAARYHAWMKVVVSKSLFAGLPNVKGMVAEDVRITDSPLCSEPVLEIRVRPRRGMLRCSQCGRRRRGHDQGGACVAGAVRTSAAGESSRSPRCPAWNACISSRCFVFRH